MQPQSQIAHEYNGYNKLKWEDVWYTKLANFESIAKHRNISIVLHIPKNDNRKDAGTVCQLVYGKTHLTISTSRRWM